MPYTTYPLKKSKPRRWCPLLPNYSMTCQLCLTEFSPCAEMEKKYTPSEYSRMFSKKKPKCGFCINRRKLKCNIRIGYIGEICGTEFIGKKKDTKCPTCWRNWKIKMHCTVCEQHFYPYYEEQKALIMDHHSIYSAIFDFESPICYECIGKIWKPCDVCNDYFWGVDNRLGYQITPVNSSLCHNCDIIRSHLLAGTYDTYNNNSNDIISDRYICVTYEINNCDTNHHKSYVCVNYPIPTIAISEFTNSKNDVIDTRSSYMKLFEIERYHITFAFISRI